MCMKPIAGLFHAGFQKGKLGISSALGWTAPLCKVQTNGDANIAFLYPFSHECRVYAVYVGFVFSFCYVDCSSIQYQEK